MCVILNITYLHSVHDAEDLRSDTKYTTVYRRSQPRRPAALKNQENITDWSILFMHTYMSLVHWQIKEEEKQLEKQQTHTSTLR